MAFISQNPNGITTAANSAPVVIASDQPPIAAILTSSTTALNAGIRATMTAYGYQRMTLEPRVEFSDPFDGNTIDDTNWIKSGTVTQSNSLVSIGNVLTTSTINSLTSRPVFPPLGLSFQVLGFVANFESNPLSTTNINRFYGFGLHTSTPSLATPITDGVGFEWDAATNKLYGAVWQNGTRSASSLDLTAYVASSSTRYAILYRSDLVIFYISSTEIPVGSISFITPYTQSLPVKLQTIIGPSTPSTTPLNTIGGITVGDTGGNSTQLSDGDYPYRKAKIDPDGSISVAVKNDIVDNNTILLRRILKILETLSIVDAAQRQRIVIDAISGSLTLSTVSTVTAVTTVTTLANGQTAHSAASTGSPVRIAGRVVTAPDTTLASGDASDLLVSSGQQAIIKSNQVAEQDFTFIHTFDVTTTSIRQIIPASGTASVRNYITGITFQTDAIGTAGSVWFLDGSVAGSAVTIATPGVFTSATHDLRIGDAIIFTSLGTITGVSTNTIYYITATTFAATTFTVTTAQGSAAIAITGSTSAFTFYRVLYQLRLQTTAVATPAVINFSQPLRPQANIVQNLLIPTTLTSGSIYLTINGYRGF